MFVWLKESIFGVSENSTIFKKIGVLGVLKNLNANPHRVISHFQGIDKIIRITQSRGL